VISKNKLAVAHLPWAWLSTLETYM